MRLSLVREMWFYVVQSVSLLIVFENMLTIQICLQQIGLIFHCAFRVEIFMDGSVYDFFLSFL